jgi:hypothetical protein
MFFTLTNFNQVLESTILQRGRRYYDDGRVFDLEEVDTGRWQAGVEGTDIYQIVITIAPDGAIDWGCDCPYDWGPVCKHVTAVLYAIEEAAAPSLARTKKPAGRRKTLADKVREALSTLSHGELHDLLLEQALDDRNLAHMILARYGGEQEGKKGYVRLVKDALHLGQGRHGFLDYRGSVQAAKGIGQVIGRAEDYLAQEQPLQAIPIFQAVVETVVPAIGHADDSMGMLGDCIHFALESLQRAADQLAPKARADLFDYCIAEAPKESYEGWDWGWDLASIAAELVTTPQQRGELFATLDQMASRREADGWLADFHLERAASIKLSVIQQHDDDKAVQSFLEQHIHHEGQRVALARFHLDRGDPSAARQVCHEWLDQPDTNKPGLRSDFLAILLDVAEVDGDYQEQIRLAETLFQDTGQFVYYERLKELIGPEEWHTFRPGFLQRISRDRHVRIDMGALYVAEEMWESLLAYVQAYPHGAGQYHEYLAARYPRELSDVYEQLALITVERKVNRSGYQRACGYLLTMQRLGQGERVAEVVEQWRVEYKRRPALQDELNKAFGR